MYSRYGYKEVHLSCFTNNATFVDNIFIITLNTVSKYACFVVFQVALLPQAIKIKPKFINIHNTYGKVNLLTRFYKDWQMLFPDCFACFSDGQALKAINDLTDIQWK